MYSVARHELIRDFLRSKITSAFFFCYHSKIRFVYLTNIFCIASLLIRAKKKIIEDLKMLCEFLIAERRLIPVESFFYRLFEFPWVESAPQSDIYLMDILVCPGVIGKAGLHRLDENKLKASLIIIRRGFKRILAINTRNEALRVRTSNKSVLTRAKWWMRRN